MNVPQVVGLKRIVYPKSAKVTYAEGGTLILIIFA
jgi:hypothetical protein